MLGTDLLEDDIDFPLEHFNLAVFYQSSFYFLTPDLLGRFFARLRPWAKRLGYIDWDLRPTDLEQVSHLLGLLLKNQLKTIDLDHGYLHNAWCPILPETVHEMAKDAGWRIIDEQQFESPAYLRDGTEWDPPLAVYLAKEFMADREAFSSVHEYDRIALQSNLLKGLIDRLDMRSLDSHGSLAE